MSIVVKNLEFGKGIPKICIPFMPVSLETIEKEWEMIKDLDFDIIEWRMDYFKEIKNKEARHKAIQTIHNMIDKPLLSTFRTSLEGGEMDVSIDEYIMINKDIVESGYTDIIDVEAFMNEKVVHELVLYAHKHHVFVIGSNHDFTITPSYEEIMKRLSIMKDKQVDIVKIAYMPKNNKDVVSILEATADFKHQYDIPIVSMAMGKEGMISRVSGEIFGSCMTFGCASNASAPGQIHVSELKSLLEIVHKSM